MPYVDVTVDVDLDMFDDDDLIAELENRGWRVSPERNWEPDASLTDEEKDLISSAFCTSKPGTVQYEIYEKLRKR